MKKILILFVCLYGMLTFSLDIKMEKLITEKYPMINSIVNVTDDGHRLKELNANNFDVWVKTKVPFSIENSNLPLSIIILLDKSGSMKDNMNKLKLAAKRFLKTLKPVDEVSLIVFDKKTYFMQEFTKNREIIEKSFKDIRSDGATRLYDAIYYALDRNKNKKSYTTIVLFTDGRDERFEGSQPISEKNPEDIIELANMNQVPVHVIGFGKYIDRDVLEYIADKTHGKFYFAPKSNHFERIYENIADGFNNLTNVTYTSPFKDWYPGKRVVEITAKANNKKASDSKYYIRDGKDILEKDTPVNADIVSMLENIPRVTIVATDRENRLIDGNFKILVNGKVVDDGRVVNGTAVVDIKDYIFDENFKRKPDSYEKMHKKNVLFTPELKLRVFTTEANNQFVPMKIQLISIDGKKEMEFFTTFDGIGTDLISQDLTEGVYALRVKRNNIILQKDVIKIEKGRRLTRDYKFGKIIFKTEGIPFSDKENSMLKINIFNLYTGKYDFKDMDLYKLTGGESFIFLPPGKYRIELKNKDTNNKFIKDKLEFDSIILGGESIKTNIHSSDVAGN